MIENGYDIVAEVCLFGSAGLLGHSAVVVDIRNALFVGQATLAAQFVPRVLLANYFVCPPLMCELPMMEVSGV